VVAYHRRQQSADSVCRQSGCGQSDCGSMAEALWAAIGACRPRNAQGCCGRGEEQELLTKALIDTLEQVKVLGSNGEAVAGSCGDSAPACEAPVAAYLKQQMGVPSERQQSRSERSTQGFVPSSASREGPGAAATSSTLGALEPPPEFDQARGAVFGDGAAGASQAVAEEQERCLHTSLKAFTRAMLRGVGVCVLLDDGRSRLAEARMDSGLTHLVLHVPNAQHPIALGSIESVSCPEDGWLPAGAPSGGQFDESCATLVMEGGQFLTLVFDGSRTREYFEMCLKVLILAHETSGASAACGVDGSSSSRCGGVGGCNAPTTSHGRGPLSVNDKDIDDPRGVLGKGDGANNDCNNPFTGKVGVRTQVFTSQPSAAEEPGNLGG